MRIAGRGRLTAALLSCALAQGASAQGFPVPLEVVAPAPPVPFHSEGRKHLVYELYLRNFGGPLILQRLELLDGQREDGIVLADLDEAALAPLVQLLGPRPAAGGNVPTLPPGGTAIVFLSVPLDSGSRIRALRHRVTTSAGQVLTAPLALAASAAPVFTAPVQGKGWTLTGGPDNASGHRRGVIVSDGRAQISRRYAMDWTRSENGMSHRGDAARNASYLAYGQEVLAVADATVVDARDGVPENTPGAAPTLTSLDGIPGNFVTLRVADGIYARYMHLQTGSLRVQRGQRVRRGQVIGLLGNSGDSRAPHLHFEVTTTSTMLGGEGLPYVLEEYWTVATDGSRTRHRRELPIPRAGVTIDIGKP